jgi:hypothetical protein
MQYLRNAKFITRLVLVWFALFLGTAIASSIVQPGNLQMVCSVGGSMKLVDSTDGSDELKVATNLDCPLCAAISAPPLANTAYLVKPSPLAHALQPLQLAHIASVTAPPLPSRGPPTFL